MPKRSKKQSAASPRVENDAPVPRAENDALRPGDVVVLPDGGMAAVEKIVGSDAYVVEWQKQIGRGPWIFPVSDLSLVAP
ncbi:MAG TPA: hypothetical protein VLE97_09660 [Gaiellaceae bacterium]|nr:hypothetical protein [Gaiellaceae bacterium]